MTTAANPTAEYRTAQLAEARREARAARRRWITARTTGGKRTAAEELEFWTNKAAFLANAK